MCKIPKSVKYTESVGNISDWLTLFEYGIIGYVSLHAFLFMSTFLDTKSC